MIPDVSVFPEIGRGGNIGIVLKRQDQGICESISSGIDVGNVPLQWIGEFNREKTIRWVRVGAVEVI